jgi:hypothetical protein
VSYMDDNAKCEAIEAAFRELPAVSDDDPTTDLLLGVVARQLVKMKLDRRSAEEESRIRELPAVAPMDSLSKSDWDALRRSPRPPNAKELQQLSRALKALGKLPPPVQDMLSREAPGFLICAKTLLSAERKAGRGQPKKTQKGEIAWKVGYIYHRRTGKKPTVSNQEEGKARGPFLNLLTNVYQILGIPGGAERQAKVVSEGWGQRTQV